jgi:hypothetical protein
MEAKTNPAKPPCYLPDVVTFLRSHFGVEFSFDDSELTEVRIAARDIKKGELLTVLKTYAEGIALRLRIQREWLLHSCVGGPMNGEHHEGLAKGDGVLFHLSRGRWAVYEVAADGCRAFFRGIATSQKNAIREKFIAERK